MSLEDDIEDIRAGIKAGRFSNEASVSQGIVLRILNALGWPTYDTQVVCPEYSLEGRRVDFALCRPGGQPIAFVEVKQVGQSEGAERQLFEYAFVKGVQLAILTDGQAWNFFLPGEQGDFGERRVYKLDIGERSVAECVARLARYINYDDMVSGKAIQAARDDYKDVARDREMKVNLPRAWTKLVSEEDDLLLELVADQVQSLCGYKPDLDTVATFLRDELTLRSSTFGFVTQPPRTPASPLAAKPPTPGAPRPLNSTGYVLHGQQVSSRNALDVLTSVFEALAKLDPSFLDRFAALPKHGRTRRYVARTPEELYPGRPDLASEYSVRLSSGWWLGTNLSRAAIARIIEMACEVAHIEFRRDLVINLGA